MKWLGSGTGDCMHLREFHRLCHSTLLTGRCHSGRGGHRQHGGPEKGPERVRFCQEEEDNLSTLLPSQEVPFDPCGFCSAQHSRVFKVLFCSQSSLWRVLPCAPHSPPHGLRNALTAQKRKLRQNSQIIVRRSHRVKSRALHQEPSLRRSPLNYVVLQVL